MSEHSISATSAVAPTPNGVVTTNGHAPSVDEGFLLQYLPAPYHADPFMRRFLHIFESILGPIERTVDTLPSYFDPRLTPTEMLPWLASWVGQELDENWPLERRREMAARAAVLHRRRGTRRGLREHLRIYTGHTPLIVENFNGLRLGQDAALGVNTRLGEPRPHSIAVTVVTDHPEQLDEGVLRRIVEVEKPAHVGYSLELRPRRDVTPGGSGPAGSVGESGPSNNGQAHAAETQPRREEASSR